MEQSRNKYNLLIITPDQMRADYLGCYGNGSIGTKYLDQLAKEGVRLENCYCAAPLCGPSRISFATSTYFSEHNHRDYGATINPDVPNLVTSLKKRGYRTGMFGKNHLFSYERLPELWDELDEICLGNCDGHEKYVHSFSSFTMEKEHPYHITGRLTEEIIEFMEAQEDPFLAWVNYQDPHPAFACPEPYASMFSPEEVKLSASYSQYDKDMEPVRNEVWRRHSRMDLCSEQDMKKAVAVYMGQVRYVDDMVGKLMKFLKESEKEKNTVILFFADHGELLGDHGMTHKLPAFYDSLSRIPVILKHPEKRWQERVFRGLVEEVDLVPTLLDILNIPIPPTMVGTSLMEELENGTDNGKESILCEAGIAAPVCKEPIKGLELKAPFAPTSFGCGAMVRTGKFKLSVYADDMAELYDLEADPLELQNLYGNAAYADVEHDLMVRLVRRLLSVKLRNTGKIEWDYEDYPLDVRQNPLE